jgi:hypothetical protein
MFAIPTPLRRSSERNLAGRRSDLLVNICVDLGATAYISAPGAAAYLLEDVSKFSKQGIDVTFHQYQHPEYDQRFSPFMPYASSLDLLFNEGQRSNEILRTGRGLPISPAELHSFVSPGASA